MERKITGIAALIGMAAIILGAFGAHALKKQLSIDQIGAFETGVKYQIYHALFLLFLGLNTSLKDNIKKTVLRLVIFGVILFSGSIYLLSTKPITGVDFKIIGIATPVGGALLIVAWIVLFWNIWKVKR
ncbi:MAG: DUF423 domain-containing protein [Flavobacteriaceae bacterium]|nr:DUF423 domain-containing protein [Flavobacteriaceae bacterium]